MSATFRLIISTPATLLIDANDVWSIRAEDASGGFGLLPGHADLLTVLPASVVRWRTRNGTERYCAVGGGILTATDGDRVAIACRQAALGNDLRKLEAEVRTARAAQADATARAHVEQTRLHAGAVRQLIRYLRPSGLTESLLLDRERDAS